MYLGLVIAFVGAAALHQRWVFWFLVPALVICGSWLNAKVTESRNDAQSANIPIVMITSRTADKHRNRAAELGVDRFLGKPYQEDELLGALKGLLGDARQ